MQAKRQTFASAFAGASASRRVGELAACRQRKTGALGGRGLRGTVGVASSSGVAGRGGGRDAIGR